MNGHIVEEKFFVILGLIYWSCAAMDLIVFKFMKTCLDYWKQENRLISLPFLKLATLK